MTTTKPRPGSRRQYLEVASNRLDDQEVSVHALHLLPSITPASRAFVLRETNARTESVLKNRTFSNGVSRSLIIDAVTALAAREDFDPPCCFRPPRGRPRPNAAPDSCTSRKTRYPTRTTSARWCRVCRLCGQSEHLNDRGYSWPSSPRARALRKQRVQRASGAPRPTPGRTMIQTFRPHGKKPSKLEPTRWKMNAGAVR